MSRAYLEVALDLLPESQFEGEVVTEVDAFDVGVAAEGVGGAGAEDGAVGDDVGAVGDGESFADAVVGDEDADALVFEVEDDALDFEDLFGVDAGEGFVEQEEAGFDDEGAGDFDAAAFSAGEHVAFRLAHLVETELVDERVHAGAAVVGVDGERLQNGEEVFLDGEFAEDGGLLRQVGDAEAGALVHGAVGDVFAIEEDAAGVGTDESDDDVKAGGFARAVGAEEADYFALADVERNIVYDLAAAVGFGDLSGFELAHVG